MEKLVPIATLDLPDSWPRKEIKVPAFETKPIVGVISNEVQIHAPDAEAPDAITFNGKRYIPEA